MSNSQEKSQYSITKHKRSEEDLCINQRLTYLIKRRTSYVNASNKQSKKEIDLHKDKIDYVINKIREITSEYCKIEGDERHINKALNYCTDQEFRVIQIYKSINSYFSEYNNQQIASSVSRHSRHSENPSRQHISHPHKQHSDNRSHHSDKLHHLDSSHHSDRSNHSHGSYHSKTSNHRYHLRHVTDHVNTPEGYRNAASSGINSVSSASYLAVMEKRKSTAFAKALAAQAEENSQRQ